MDNADGLLADRLTAGDPEAFASLYAAHGASLYGYLLSATGKREVAEDLLQVVWLRLVRYRRRLRRVKKLRAYLFTTARNEVRRRGVGRAEPTPLHEVENLTDPPPPVPSDDGDAMRAAVARLSPERREVVTLKAWHGLTFAEIGTVLAVSPNTAASRYRLALADLEAMLRETIDVTR